MNSNADEVSSFMLFLREQKAYYTKHFTTVLATSLIG